MKIAWRIAARTDHCCGRGQCPPAAPLHFWGSRDNVGVSMNFEEQAEFLMQSIASHDRQIGELTDGMAQLKDGLGQTRSMLHDYIAESRESTKEMKLAISRLATAMHGLNEHVTDHKTRIERLEEGRA
jgi:hypothetical protein